MPALTVTARMSRKSGRSRSMLSRRRRPCPEIRARGSSDGDQRAEQRDQQLTLEDEQHDDRDQQQDPPADGPRSRLSTLTPTGRPGGVDQLLQVADAGGPMSRRSRGTKRRPTGSPGTAGSPAAAPRAAG